MTGHEHRYSTTITWENATGEGTTRRGDHSRDHEIAIEGKPVIAGSSDPAFRGDSARHNPEDLFVASLSACHMLWYLSLCGKAGIVVTEYIDCAEGIMEEAPDGGGRFTRVILRPEITLATGSDRELADRIHHDAHKKCFIAQSVTVPVSVEATYRDS